jgi:hypothetical protein
MVISFLGLLLIFFTRDENRGRPMKLAIALVMVWLFP